MELSSAEPKNKYQETISTLPRLKWFFGMEILFHESYWSIPSFVEGAMQAQEHFTPQPHDVFLCTLPKSGTTWLKALGAAIVTRKHLDDPQSNPLLNKLSHDIVYFLESQLYPQPSTYVRDPEIPLIATHLPYESLPKSIINSGCKLIYLCREPKDVFCSNWHFLQKFSQVEGDGNLEDMLESFCKGDFLAGPFWINMLSYWKASLEFPDKVMFLKYEDLKEDPVIHVKKIANFMGYPFTVEEEEKGVVEKIVELCSFDSMSSLQVNATGKVRLPDGKIMENNSFFRKGNKGDWKNLLTPEMAKKLDKITEEKLSASGLTFN